MMENKIQKMKERLAIVILAYADYESLELTLAAHCKHLPVSKSVCSPRLFVLQNGRNTYDCERTYEVAKRYQTLYPNVIEVIDDIPPDIPYFSLKKLFNSDKFEQFDYIVKLDDDVLPLTSTWLEDLCQCYCDSFEQHGEKLAYVTSLVNNNPYGFKKVLDLMGLEADFNEKYARDHMVGLDPNDPYSPYRIMEKGSISIGGGGTIWRYPYIARWIHEKTTLQPENFIKATQNKGYDELNTKLRYSINCLLFKKNLWNRIDNGGQDDELMLQQYCIRENMKAVANLSVPMCHLFFYTQRLENKDLLDKFRSRYTDWLNLPFPISLIQSRDIEIENRIKYLEKHMISITKEYSRESKEISKHRERWKRYRKDPLGSLKKGLFRIFKKLG